MTKAAINKLLVEERAKMRTKQRNSRFMSRTLSIYKGQLMRLRELAHIPTRMLPYTLAEFRADVAAALKIGLCCYCSGKLTIKTLTPDHKLSLVAGGNWSLGNLDYCCQSCNWQKGRMSADEFKALLAFCAMSLSQDSATDLRRRLTIGGKWSPR
jgi:5-methylcytosine-specific restriction endonuclease McrA